MKQIYAFEEKKEYEKYQAIIQRFGQKLNDYKTVLENEYALTDPPKGVLWTTEELATTVFSDVPIPAYTNEDLIYMSPDLESWRKLFIRQLDKKDLANIRRFYETYSENQMFIILAHELTHHSNLFLDEFEDADGGGIWFEEGMCFYLPRRLLLSETEFDAITHTEMELVKAFNKEYGNSPLEDFGSSSYQGSLSSIMFDYWRSFLAVKYLVDDHANQDVKLIFDEYHK